MRTQSRKNINDSTEKLPVRQKWDRRYAAFHPVARRRPTAFVARCLSQFPTEGRALDIAAGAGRHSLALAKHGLRVDAVDISLYGLQLARERARKAGVFAQIQFIVADVESIWLPHCQYDVILVSSFLYRPLFQLIKERLKAGGRLAYETFTVAQMTQPYHRHSSCPEFYLQPGELHDAFSDFSIIHYDESDHNGRATARLLAQKV